MLAMDKVLDLYNFDANEASSSRYVLTSPRSLEACSRMKVKPVQLLPKTRSDFGSENPGKSSEFLEILYNDWEEKRVALLQKCRHEREKIIMEQQISKKKVKRQAETKVFSNKTENSNKNEVSFSSKMDKPVLKRMSKLDQLRTKSVFNASPNPAIFTIKSSPSISPIEKLAATYDDYSRSKSQQSTTKMFVNKSDGLRSKSVDNENRLLKPHNAAVRSSSVLGDASAMASGYITPQIERDRRLVEIMKERRKQEQAEEKCRREKILSWSKEKKREEEMKKKETIQRQRELANNQLLWERKLKEEEMRKLQILREIETERLRQQEENEAAVKSNKQKQEMFRLLQMEERKKQINERKKCQERALNITHQEHMAFQKATEQELKSKQEKAFQSKLENEMKELQKVKMMNKRQQERLHEIQKELKKREEDEGNMKREVLEEKLQRAAENYSKKVLKRDLHIKSQSRQTVEKIDLTKKNLKRMDQESEEYKQSILEQTNERMKKAGDVALQNTQNKANRAKYIRKSSEEGWKKNLHQMHEKENEAMQKTKENIELKENKVKRHLQLREAAFEFSRVQAKINEAERELMKRQSTNFNQMAQKAKLTADIGRGPRSSFVNHSTVKLG